MLHLGDNRLQFLGGVVALDGEVAELLPRRCMSLSQLVPKLMSLLVDLVSGGYQIFFHRLFFCLIGVQPHPQINDDVLREERNQTDATSQQKLTKLLISSP